MLVYTRGTGAGRWCWGRFRQHEEDEDLCLLNESDLRSLEGVEHRHVPGKGESLFMCATVSAYPRKYKVVVSSFALRRLFRRFVATYLASPTAPVSKPALMLEFTSSLRALLPGRVLELRSAEASTMYSVTPSFYELASSLAAVDCELFADCVNESGVLSSFCSAKKEDAKFGSLGDWESSHNSIIGGAGNPPFSRLSSLSCSKLTTKLRQEQRLFVVSYCFRAVLRIWLRRNATLGKPLLS